MGHRSDLKECADTLGPERVAAAIRTKNTTSLDGLPGTEYWSKPR
jgi:hypothetical protein